jgi:hypothetical protein
LLKTFSVNPFQGQYPNIAVRINAAPIHSTTQRKIPSKGKLREQQESMLESLYMEKTRWIRKGIIGLAKEPTIELGFA